MSLRERLPESGYPIGEEDLIFESKIGFSIASAGSWLPGIYHTFEAAECAFKLSYRQFFELMRRRNPQIRGIILYEIEQVLKNDHH